MTPQSSFMVLAPVVEGRADELRELLASMNLRPGHGRPGQRAGAVRPVRAPARRALRRARGADRGRHHGLRPGPAPWPTSLVFLGDCDGPADSFLPTSSRAPAPGLRQIFALLPGLLGRRRPARLDEAARAAPRRRTTSTGSAAPCVQVREEQALHAALVDAPAERRGDGAGRAAGRRCATGWSASSTAERQAGRLRAHAARADAARLAPAQRARMRRRAGRPAACWRRSCGRLAAAGLPAAPAREDRSRHRAASRTSDHVRAPGRARRPRRHQSVHRVRRSQARPLPALDHDLPALAARLLGAPHLQPRLSDPGPDHSLRPLGVSGRPQARCSSPATTTAASRATWTTSSTRWPGASTWSSATASATRAPTG